VAIALIALTSAAPVRSAPIDESTVMDSTEVETKMDMAPAAERMVALESAVADLDDPVLTESYETIGQGEASYYGAELAGNRTASGERFNPQGLTAAHRSLPLGTKLRVTNLNNGRSVIVRVNDRGPFVRSRIIDVSLGAAREIEMVRSGKAQVKLEILRSTS
jgi:rare lipoprotein A